MRLLDGFWLASGLQRLRVRSDFAGPSLVLTVVVFAALGSIPAFLSSPGPDPAIAALSEKVEVEQGPRSSIAPRLVPHAVPAVLEGSRATDRMVPPARFQERGSTRMAILTTALLVLGALVAALGLAGAWSEETAARREEVAIRRAVGASRRRVVRERFAELVVLVVLAGAGGSSLAVGARALVVGSWPGVAREAAPIVGATLVIGAVVVTIVRALMLSLQATPSGALGTRPSFADPDRDLAGGRRLVVLQLASVTCLLVATVSLWSGTGSMTSAAGETARLPGPNSASIIHDGR